MKVCPLCGKRLYHDIWKDDIGYLVETIEECRLGCKRFKKHWSYGHTWFKIGKFEKDFTDHGFMNNEESEVAASNWNIFYKYLNYYRRRKCLTK